jgi:hypothetical protein
LFFCAHPLDQLHQAHPTRRQSTLARASSVSKILSGEPCFANRLHGSVTVKHHSTLDIERSRGLVGSVSCCAMHQRDDTRLVRRSFASAVRGSRISRAAYAIVRAVFLYLVEEYADQFQEALARTLSVVVVRQNLENVYPTKSTTCRKVCLVDRGLLVQGPPSGGLFF